MQIQEAINSFMESHFAAGQRATRTRQACGSDLRQVLGFIAPSHDLTTQKEAPGNEPVRGLYGADDEKKLEYAPDDVPQGRPVFVFRARSERLSAARLPSVSISC
jgi:hypothetical protein